MLLETMSTALSARPAETHALEIARTVLADRGSSAAGFRAVCTTVGRGQAAFELAAEHPEAVVTAWFLDLFVRTAAVASWESPPPGLVAACDADMPPGPYDLAVLPFSKSGEAELTRDVLQAAFMNLAIGGRLVAAIDNPRDNWLREQLAETGETVRVRPATSASGSSV